MRGLDGVRERSRKRAAKGAAVVLAALVLAPLAIPAQEGQVPAAPAEQPGREEGPVEVEPPGLEWNVAPGAAADTSVGLLMDVSVQDLYRARASSQGFGSGGGREDAGSLGVLLDADGTDAYFRGGRDGLTLTSGSYGVFIDAAGGASPKK